PVRAEQQPRRGDRQRVRRGAGHPSLRPVRLRAGAVRADAVRQRPRALLRRPRRALTRAAARRGPPHRHHRRRAHRRRGGGGMSAILGTIEMVALASVIAVPLGIGVAVWLVEYGRGSWFANAVRFFVDVLTGVPSIVFGLFVFIVLIVGTGTTYAGWKGSVALSLLMLPVVVRSAEVILNLVPNGLRESALALGAPRWRVVGRIVLPTALPGMVTGVLLAVARAAGETAPLLFTAAYTHETTTNLGSFMNSLPVQIYNDVISPTPRVEQRAWGAALTLVALILALNLTA